MQNQAKPRSILAEKLNSPWLLALLNAVFPKIPAKERIRQGAERYKRAYGTLGFTCLDFVWA